MISMEMMGKIRRMYFRDKLSLHEIAKRTGLARNTIRKWVRAPEAKQPVYQRRAIFNKLSPFHATLEQALKADSLRPKQQRRSAKRARLLLKRAETLVEDGQRSEASNERLETLLNEARQQLEMAELLGYGKKKDFEPLYAELKKVKQKTAGGGGGKGWLDEIKAKLSKLF
ncbi:transposase [Pseudomonas aeruginosa PA38182]|nr:transposase [Pseudomonas aeruginosa PA38182]